MTVHNPKNLAQSSSKKLHGEALLTHLLAVSRRMAEKHTLESLLSFAIDEVLQLVGAERGHIVLVDKEGLLDFKVKRKQDGSDITLKTDSISHSVLDEVIQTQKSLIIKNAIVDPNFGAAPSVMYMRLRSIMCAPLISQNQIIGAIYVENRSRSGRFREEDLTPLEFFSNQAAVSIENARIEEELRLSLQEKEVLLKEIHHRVKNNLQIVSGLLDLQADYIKDQQVQSIFQESRNRIKSMALVHEQLYQSQNLARIDFASYIEHLVQNLHHSYNDRLLTVSYQINVVPITVTIETAIPCGLIITELVTNALKYAFHKDASGQIGVELQSDEAEQLILIVRDNGVGLPADLDVKQANSLGFILVNTLIKQLKGSLTLHRHNGTAFEISFASSSTTLIL